MPAEFQNALSLSWERKGAGAAQVRSQTLTRGSTTTNAKRLGQLLCSPPTFISKLLLFSSPRSTLPAKGHSLQSPLWGSSTEPVPPPSHAAPTPDPAGRWESTGRKEPTDMYNSPAASVLVCGGIVHTREIIQVCKTKLGHRIHNHLCQRHTI